MNYMTTKEVAEKWSVSDRRVLQYCTSGRIIGAQKIGNLWLIPKNAVKPEDMRTKKSK